MNLAALVCAGILLAMLGAVVGLLWGVWILVRVFSALKKEAEKTEEGSARRNLGGGKSAFASVAPCGCWSFGFASNTEAHEELHG